MAEVPVPHGERSIAPVHVAGRSQSSVPVETVTTLRRLFAGSWAGPDSCPMVIPAKPGWSGWTTGNCSFAAALIISVMRTMSAPSSGVRRRPNALGVGDHVEHPAVRHVDRDGPQVRDLDGRRDVRREGRHVAERDAR